MTPENTEVKQKKDTRFKKGVSGNPKGKPKGAKNKFSFVKEWQEGWANDPEGFKKLAAELLKDKSLRALIIQMVDGRPQQDVTSGGEKLNPIPILGGISSNDGNAEGSIAKEKD